MINRLRYKKVSSTLIVFAISMQLFSFIVLGQSLKNANPKMKVELDQELNPQQEINNENASKIAPDLEEKADELNYGFRSDETRKVIIQLDSKTPLNEMFGNRMSEEDQKAMFAREANITTVDSGILASDLVARRGTMNKVFKNIGLVSAELPLSEIHALAQSKNVSYISPDREVQSSGWHVAETSGANDASAGISGRRILGAGVGVAILDSGIDTTHKLMARMASPENQGNVVIPKNPGVVYSKDFTGQNLTTDNFGHGTHVATMLYGSWKNLGGKYRGTAWASNLFNLRVLNDNGVGVTSQVIAAIDWSIANKTTYNIRVLNMSLGAVVNDSYKTDPLCLAVRRATNAGILVVAAAGNDGKDTNGVKLYGGIHSPGSEPTAITVGAINTFGTDYRSDDQVASFSSRGPTRGYQIVNGVKKFDNLIKPDIVAPGNKLIGAASAPSQTKSNSLFNMHPSLKTGTTTGSSQLMYLSGTSMAAPIVAGIAAQLIEANPNLTPNLVKAVLMFSAQQINGANTLEQGAGIVNAEGAMEIVEVMKTSFARLSNGSTLLTRSLPRPNNTIGGETVYWGKGVITNHVFLSGDELMTKWQGMYGMGVLMSDGTPLSNGVFSRLTSLTTNGVLISDGVLTSDGVLMSDGGLFVSGILMGDGTSIGQGVLMGDGVLMCDSTPRASNAIFGDETQRMLP